MGTKKLTIQLIESLEKREFDELVKLYLKNEFGLKKIVITDGKDDVGLDIKVFLDDRTRKIQYQLTTQKSKTAAEKIAFNKKVIEDFEKAQKNYQDYFYSNKLIYFYSYSLTNKQIRELEKLADKEYNLELDFIEANRIAEESEDIKDIQNFLFDLIGIKDDNKIEGNNLLYDLISFGRPAEFKHQIVEAYMLELFLSKNTLTLEEIKSKVEEKFKLDGNNDFYKKIISIFLTNKTLVKDKDKNSYYITPESYKELNKRNNEFLLERGLFKNYVRVILQKYNQQDFLEEYVSKLNNLYTDNFDKDLEDISSNKESYQLSNIYNEFSSFIKLKIDGEFDHNDLALDLLQLCQRNKFIQKISASNVYINKINDKNIQKFLNIKKKIFIDTSIALYSICYYFRPSSKYDNFYYNTSKKLLELIRNEKIDLFISERYIWEIANHFRDAFRLIPFSDIISNQKLGSSKNVFYNFYLHLKNNENYNESFSNFIDEYGIKENASKESFNSHIKKFLSELKILEEKIEKEYDISELNEFFEDFLKRNYKRKTNFAKNCDSIMFSFLADNDIEVHKLEPIFLTWDKSFQEVQNIYLKYYPDSQKWLNITPNKYIDSNSLLKFSIDNETLTDNLLAFISDDIVMNTHSLIDSLSLILNPTDEVGLEIANKLSKLREEEINRIATSEVHTPENYEGDAVLDDVVFNITDYYKTKDNFNEFKKLFTNKALVDKIIDLIERTINSFYEKKEIDTVVYDEFDFLINNNVSFKSDHHDLTD